MKQEAARPLIGDEAAYGVIDPDVLWSCTNCGACVNQCPVDIEHVDHIIDMRRYQVLVENNFPAELSQLFRGLEGKGNPWNMSPTMRMDWAKGLDFDVPVVGEDLESLESVDWLFWVGCAGAYEDRAKKTTRAVAELLNIAGISFGVLGNGETCTGDAARRAGNEFVYQGLAQQNVATLTEAKTKQVVTTCAHCFNTLKNEYRDFGLELEVVHHTQLLNRLVRDGRLTPVADGAGAAKRSITYHDPCFLGRHNQVYSPPRELLQVLPGASYVEMERSAERSFCCGAGGARMWMEERIGERINENRTREAVATGADQIAVGCPFCRVMLDDGLTAAQSKGEARDEVEVLDVAQMLLASVKGVSATRTRRRCAGTAPGPAAPPAAGESDARRRRATPLRWLRRAPRRPSRNPRRQSRAAPSSTTPPRCSATRTVRQPQPTEAKSEVEGTQDAEGKTGGSLFGDGASLFDTPVEEETKHQEEPEAAAVGSTIPEGTSLFDVGASPEPRSSRQASAARHRRPTHAGRACRDHARSTSRPGTSATTSPRASHSSTSAEPDPVELSRSPPRRRPTTPRRSSTPTTSPSPRTAPSRTRQHPAHRREHQRRGVALRLVTRTDAVPRRNHVRWRHK